MARIVVLVLMALVIAAGGVDAKKKKYDPFLVPREEFLSSVKTIALRGVGVPDDLADPDSVRARFDSLLTSELEGAGFAVIPPNEYDRLWKEGADSLGGLFDPQTGQRDTAKARQIRMGTLQELKARFQVDAVLHPSFLFGNAEFGGGIARWDGQSQRMTKGFMGFLAGGQSSGTISAVSLLVIIEDVAGKDLYSNRGGLCVTGKYDGRRFVDLPQDSLFSNPERNAEAVHLALRPLTKPEGK